MVKISEKELDVLKHQRVARFATIMENGFAHVVPMIYAFNGENIYIATPLGFKKLKNLVKNKKVTLLVDEYSVPHDQLQSVRNEYLYHRICQLCEDIERK